MQAYKLELYGNSVKDLQEQFEAYVAQQRPEPNKLQKLLYGDRLNEMSDELIRDIVENSRGCGKTTALALQDISNAIWSKGREVGLNYECPNSAANEWYHKRIEQIVQQLGLNFIYINRAAGTIRLDI